MSSWKAPPSDGMGCLVIILTAVIFFIELAIVMEIVDFLDINTYSSGFIIINGFLMLVELVVAFFITVIGLAFIRDYQDKRR